MRGALAAAVMFLCVGAARADGVTGNELLELQERNGLAALYYAIGVAESADILARAASSGLPAGTPRYRFRGCPPDEVTNGQLRDVALKYLRDNPKDRHLSASFLLITAWLQAWPCKPG